MQAGQALADVLKRGCHSLRYDPTFTAGKKLTKEERQRAQSDLDDFAKARKRSSKAAHALIAKTMLLNTGSSDAAEQCTAVAVHTTEKTDSMMDMMKVTLCVMALCILGGSRCQKQ